MVLQEQQVFIAALDRILRPVVRFCLRHSIKLQIVMERVKVLLVQEAKRLLESEGKDVSVSRIHVMTGVHRPDVAGLIGEKERALPLDNVLTRVLGAWQGQRRFTSKSGKPRILSTTGHHSEFAKLVRAVQGDLNPYTVLFELERSGTVERTARGVKVKSRFQLPAKSIETGFSIAGSDVEDLVRSVEQNVSGEGGPPHLHIRTEYDRIPKSALPSVQRWILAQGSAFHRRARKFLSQFDADMNPAIIEQSNQDCFIRVGVTAFSWSDSVQPPRSTP